MTTQRLLAMLSLGADDSVSGAAETSKQQRWKSLLMNKRAHRSCTDDYSSLRTDEEAGTVLPQPMEIFHYLRSRRNSVDSTVIESERRGSKSSRKTSLKTNDSVFLSDFETSLNLKRDKLTKQKQMEKFYQNRSVKAYTAPQSPFLNYLSAEHFRFDLYSTTLEEDIPNKDDPSITGNVCGELVGYVRYHIEIEQLEIKLVNVSMDSTKTEKKEPFTNMFVRIQLLPHKNDSFFSSLMKGESMCQWNCSWLTGVTFEESQLAKAQFLVRTISKGNFPRSLGAAEVDLRKFDIINGEHFRENVHSGGLTDELGEIQVSLSYAPDLKQMTMTIGKVRNLVKKDFFRRPDTFVKMSLYNQKKIAKVKKTTVKRSTYHPLFNEHFLFEISEAKSSDIFVVVSIYDKHSTTKDDCLGRLIFGSSKKASSSLQAEHWAETIGSSWTTVTRWHPIISKDKCSSISSTSSEDNKM